MKKELKNAIKDTLPVLAGYLVLGMGFGMIMESKGFSFFITVAMSLFIYAGSMQYAAIGLMTGGASMLTVGLTTLAVNARHFFYGISMIEKYKGTGIKKPYMIFSLTDETYSLVCTGDKSTDYCFFVSLIDHIYWVGGTALGAIIGGAVHINTTGIDFALTALFITVFCDQWMSGGGKNAQITGLAASVLCLIIFGASSFLIPAMLLISAVLLLGYVKEAVLKTKHT